ncbi:unnamed protein product [Lactuca virosa]|uniref:BED-type domain-containing protein n=1 Tax=Lactuca virosa TaxID=75947 RepID=A0AAU9NG91_9ASTR|nr:unnamed protein product [Lactuca virosa]
MRFFVSLLKYLLIISVVAMGASSKQDRLKDVKVKPPDKGAVGRFVRTEVDLSDVIPPGVVDQSSSTIYRARRKPSATGAIVSRIGKAEWKLEGLHKARKPNRGDSLLRTPMDAEDYYVDDVTEEEREDVSESDGVWESDSSASRVAGQASIKDSSSNVMDEVTKDLPPIIHEDSIPSVYGNDDSICLAVINGKNVAVKSDIQDVIDKDGEGYTMVTKKARNAGTATVKGYSRGDIQPQCFWKQRSHSGNWNKGTVSQWNHQKNQEFVAANNKSFIVNKQGHNGKESVDSGKKEEKVKKGKGLKGSQRENSFGNTVNWFAERFYSYSEKASRVAKCCLCGGNTGAFRKSTNGQWVHAFCAEAETQKHGVEEWNSLKKVRVELERLRLICERIIKREKLKVMIKIWVNGVEGQKIEGQSATFSAKIAETVDGGAK